MAEIDLGGTMLPIPSETLLNEYVKLFQVMKEKYWREKLSCFFPMCGSSYFDSPVRVMIVGRCTNGWDPLSMDAKEDDFYCLAKEKMMDKENFGRKGFSWLMDNGLAKETYIKKWKDKNGNEMEKICRYNINRSAFFRTIRKILKQVKPESSANSRWFEHFVWTNLYPISPLEGGNADARMKEIELASSKEILIGQIEYFRPTHIVFITDNDYWFCDFKDIFPNMNTDFHGEKGYVVGKGIVGKTKAVVTIRPDRTRPNKPNEEEFAWEVYENLE